MATMRRRHAVLLTLVILLLCMMAAAYSRYHPASSGSHERAATRAQSAPASSASPTARRADSPPHAAREAQPNPQELPPPPPPGPTPLPAGASPAAQPTRDEPLALTGTTQEALERIQERLPEPAQIYTYPVSPRHARAAVAKSDMDGDGSAETAVVYKSQPAEGAGEEPRLTLAVMSEEAGSLKTKMTIPLVGPILFDVNVGGRGAPLTVVDVTGDKRPEIIVASGSGASAGGWLQIFDVDGTSHRKLAHIGGHSFTVEGGGRSAPRTIKARWKDETEERLYRWGRQHFEEASKQ